MRAHRRHETCKGTSPQLKCLPVESVERELFIGADGTDYLRRDSVATLASDGSSCVSLQLGTVFVLFKPNGGIH